MNENKRILLLALGILAIVASDPPVASDFEQPRSVCSIAGDLAVSAFESLIRSTLPLSNDQPEGERTAEVLVTPIGAPASARVVHSSAREAALVPDRSPADAHVRGEGEEITASSVGIVQSACIRSGTGEPISGVDGMRGKPLHEPS